MGGVLGLISRLLAALHQGIPAPICPGDWLWTTALAGAVLAVFPVIGSLLMALIRKGTGNRYGLGTCTVFGAIGLVCCLAVPWFAFDGVSRVYSRLANGAAVTGITPASLRVDSCFVSGQASYLGGQPSVYDVVVGSGSDGIARALYVALLVAVPLLGLLFVWLQTRAATRRGPGWPRRLLYLPFMLFWLATAPFEANVVVALWLGFVPASLLGALIVLLVGAPRWSVIDRSRAGRRREPEYEPEYADDRPQHPPAQLADTPGPLPFAAGAPAPEPQTGGERFRRVRTLGKGGFGTVWLAVDTQLARTVAVKFAHAPDADTEQRILREARALAAVRHPNCARIYDIVEDSDGLGIVMEYIEGRSLTDAVKGSGALPDVAAARLWSTMAGALQAAHDKGVLHRDVKPSNVLVDPGGTPHLIDFGIARSEGDSTLTASGMMMGTPDFLAPETAAGSQATPASDAWQLAATISYALTGQPPRRHRENPMSALMAAANGESCSELPPDSAHLSMLRASLANDPAKRPTLPVLRQELAGWLGRSGYSEAGPVTETISPVDSGPGNGGTFGIPAAEPRPRRPGH